MATTTKIGYAGATTTAITVTGTSLASSTATAFTGRQSTAVDNSTNLYDDCLIRAKLKGQAGSTGLLYVWAYGSPEATTPAYTDGCTGSDAAFTAPTNGTNLRLVGIVQLSGTTATLSGPWSLAAAFGGLMPQKWGLVLQNASGGALSATAGDTVLDYQGIYYTSA